MTKVFDDLRGQYDDKTQTFVDRQCLHQGIILLWLWRNFSENLGFKSKLTMLVARICHEMLAVRFLQCISISFTS